VIVGVVYNPVLEEMYTAVRGKGAFLNGAPIQASACAQLGSALVITEVGVARDDATLSALFARMSALTQKARHLHAGPNIPISQMAHQTAHGVHA
jgi:inositol-phosphate phosphatase/L-galactose 1-phosphate phosphatase